MRKISFRIISILLVITILTSVGIFAVGHDEQHHEDVEYAKTDMLTLEEVELSGTYYEDSEFASEVPKKMLRIWRLCSMCTITQAQNMSATSSDLCQTQLFLLLKMKTLV